MTEERRVEIVKLLHFLAWDNPTPGVGAALKEAADGLTYWKERVEIEAGECATEKAHADAVETLLRNLNARLHRDGGQHADVLGSLEACTRDSDRLAAELISANDQYEAECATMRKALDECVCLDRPLASRLVEARRSLADANATIAAKDAEIAARDQRLLALEVRLHALARAAKHLALATPDTVLRSELELAVKLANEVLPKESTA